MNSEKLNELEIAPGAKRRPQQSLWVIFLAVIFISGTAVFFAWPRASDSERRQGGAAKDSGTNNPTQMASASSSTVNATTTPAPPSTASSSNADDVVLTVSGYIINRERIELS